MESAETIYVCEAWDNYISRFWICIRLFTWKKKFIKKCQWLINNIHNIIFKTIYKLLTEWIKKKKTEQNIQNIQYVVGKTKLSIILNKMQQILENPLKKIK